MFLQVLVVVLSLQPLTVFSCPQLSIYEQVDKNVEQFKNEGHLLKKISQEHEFSEQVHDSQEHNEKKTVADTQEYDFIIVGGGTSGLVLANRLSEVPEWKILVLEAGNVEQSFMQTPKFAKLLKNTHYNWGFNTVPQNYSCLGMIGHKCAINKGKSLGGSTSINDMLYVRGNKRDYDIWADKENAHWCYSDVLPYFKKIEDAHLEAYDHKYHHLGGPQHIENPDYVTHLSDSVLDSCKKLEHSPIDYNGQYQIGIGYAQLMTKFGVRNSVAQSYYKPASYRKNLVVLTNSRVVKLKVSPHTKDVNGVYYLHDGALHSAKAEKEVVLAAGAVSTPQILLLSGLGPKEEVEKHNIECIHELPVGKNLKVPVAFDIDFIHDHPHQEHLDEYSEILNYLKHHTGSLSTPGYEVLGFFRTEDSKNPKYYPDFELLFKTQSYSELDGKLLRLKKEFYNSVYKPLEGKPVATVTVIVSHPKSTGHLNLNMHPLHRPSIDPKHFTDPDYHDLKILLEGIQKVLKIADAKPFQKLNLKLNHHKVPNCDKETFPSEDYWKCAIQYLSYTTDRVSGTAIMGPDEKNSVVDTTLKVHGINKLRIADASVIPVSITGDLTAPSIMIGEKASDLIKKDWN